MKLLKYIFAFFPSFLCQAVEHSFTQTYPTEDPLRAETNMTMLPEEMYRGVYVHHLAGKCNWTLRMSGNGSSGAAPLTADFADFLMEHVCQEAGCGGVYSVAKTSSLQNTTCFHSCAYADRRLLNCSESVRSDCTVISAVVCENQAVRLSGGSDRCAGRVELWRDGRWGTVCDDQWDLREAEVVCAQLGCGYALSVTGQGGAFPAGRGPIYRDDLNCSGQEKNLWACPASLDETDCGHKEDAGVVCSEMRSVRLSGGLDHCSGKVEIHRNGSWGTICDNCWNRDMAALVCAMLQCGSELNESSWLVPHLPHNNGALYYYDCDPRDGSLWQCMELINNPFLCVTSKAAGVTCNGSLGFPAATTTAAAEITDWTTVAVAATTSVPVAESLPEFSPELLITIAVSVLLLVMLVINTVLCCHYRRRHAFLLQQKPFNGKFSSGNQQNYYKDNVDLVKVSINSHQADGPSNVRFFGTQLSSVDSTSVDTDYEQYDLSNGPSVSLSTFKNSQRYRTDINPLMKPPGLDCLSEEGRKPPSKGNVVYARHGGGTAASQHVRESMISVDSFEDSSTSSEECYENVTNVTVTPDPEPGQSSGGTSDSLIHSQYKLQPGQAADLQSSDGEDEDDLYSPVSPE